MQNIIAIVTVVLITAVILTIGVVILMRMLTAGWTKAFQRIAESSVGINQALRTDSGAPIGSLIEEMNTRLRETSDILSKHAGTSTVEFPAGPDENKPQATSYGLSSSPNGFTRVNRHLSPESD